MADSVPLQPRTVTHNGLWWLPNNPRRKIPGVLTTTGFSEATLTLTGGPRRDLSYLPGPRIELILGRTDSGERITLCYCQVGGRTRAFGPFKSKVTSVTLWVGVVLRGAHFRAERDIK